jgi:hypothetical protein
MNRRNLILTLPALAACGRKGGPGLEGRWEGKLNNGLSSMNINYDFIARKDAAGKETMEFRVTCRDLFLATHLVSNWSLAESKFRFALPLVEGAKEYSGVFGGPTFDVENKDSGEKMHLRRLGRIPQQPYLEKGLVDLEPTFRKSRARAQVLGRSEALLHFNADLLARLGVTTSAQPIAGGGVMLVEDQPLPRETPAFLILLSPSYERIPEILAHRCPLLVIVGETDSRLKGLERGSRQLAFDLREKLTKQGRTREDYQISVVPKADETLRVRGFEREYPRLTGNHLEYFRQFLARVGSPTP